MSAEIGLFCLILALVVQGLSGCVIFASAQKRDACQALVMRSAQLGFVLCAGAMTALIAARVQLDFSVENVASHANQTLPMLYRIVGAWGNHEGSMLLWALMMTGFAAMLATLHPRCALSRDCLSIQALLSAGVLIFILLTSNPFTRIFPPPWDGAALNPLLQDIALAMHPPLLYVGYVGFSLVFSLSVAGLLRREINPGWARRVRPWALAAWASLTIGIGLGSWWAYRELGWGGWWFWDPVENASLLPWLTGIALIHSLIVLQKRGAFGHWMALLAILTFAMSLVGTFLVRSGMITSVHSFASDPERGIYILTYLVLSIGAAMVVYSLRAGSIATPPPEDRALALSREGFLAWNNVLFLTLCGVVLLGTLYPMLGDAMGVSVSVGAPFFNQTTLPIMVLTLALAGIGPVSVWGRDRFSRLRRILLPCLMLSALAALAMLAFVNKEAALAAIGMGMGCWLLLASWHVRRNKAVFLAHSGAAVLAMGITGASLWKIEVEAHAQPGVAVAIGPYRIMPQAVELVRKDNHAANRLPLHITGLAATDAWLTPEYRLYDIRGTATSEAAILPRLWGDIYAVAGETRPGQGTALRLSLHPLIYLLWLGGGLMAAGALMAMVELRRKPR